MTGEAAADTRSMEAEYLTPAMLARAAALRVARDVLISGGGPFIKGSIPVEVPELVDVAVYVVDGTHPMDRYTDADEGHRVATAGAAADG